MGSRPKLINYLILLWLGLSAIFVLWGAFSLNILVRIQNWTELGTLQSQLFFGYLISTIVWFVFSSLFIIFAYATYRGDTWSWTTGLIISTLFIVIFGFMLAAFMVTSLLFFDWFSVNGLISVVLSFLTDLGIVFILSRPKTKIYYAIVSSSKT